MMHLITGMRRPKQSIRCITIVPKRAVCIRCSHGRDYLHPSATCYAGNASHAAGSSQAAVFSLCSKQCYSMARPDSMRTVKKLSSQSTTSP